MEDMPLPGMEAFDPNYRVLRQLETLTVAAEQRRDAANAMHDEYAYIEAKVLRETLDSLVTGSNALE